jgi:hypothetical protein
MAILIQLDLWLILPDSALAAFLRVFRRGFLGLVFLFLNYQQLLPRYRNLDRKERRFLATTLLSTHLSRNQVAGTLATAMATKHQKNHPSSKKLSIGVFKKAQTSFIFDTTEKQKRPVATFRRKISVF